MTNDTHGTPRERHRIVARRCYTAARPWAWAAGAGTGAGMTTRAAIDPGRHAALAVVRLDTGGPECIGLVAVTGKRWAEAMRQAIADAPSPVWIERPADKIRGVHARHHRTMFGLGRSFGRLEEMALARGKEVHETTTSAWWALLPTRLTGKRGTGEHRVEEACGMVRRARHWIDLQPASCRVDAAEAVLMAYAACLGSR